MNKPWTELRGFFVWVMAEGDQRVAAGCAPFEGVGAQPSPRQKPV